MPFPVPLLDACELHYCPIWGSKTPVHTRPCVAFDINPLSTVAWTEPQGAN